MSNLQSVTLPLLGAWGDINGRKVPILFGIVGSILAIFGYLLVVGDPDIPLQVILVTDFIAGFTGFLALVPMTCGALIADMNINKKTLTIRLVLYQVCQSIGGAVGGAIAGAISSHMSLATLGLVGMAVVTLGFLYTLVRIPQVPPVEMRRLSAERARERGDVVDEDLESEGPPLATDTSCSSILALLKEALRAYLKPREGHKRAFVLVMFFVGVILFAVISGSQMVTSLFVMRRPLSWGPSKLGYFMSVSTAVSIVGSFFGMLLFKPLLRLSDTTMMMICLLSEAAKMIMMAFSDTDWMIYAATLLAVVSKLMLPCSQSFTAQIIPANDVGKIFAGMAIGTDIGMLVGTTLFNSIYRASEEFFPGLVFLVAAAITLLLLLMVLWVHIQHKREIGTTAMRASKF